MTDNELRAHDLTMLYIQEINHLKTIDAIASAMQGDTIENRTDWFTDYVDLYSWMLEKVNKHFS